MESRLLTSDQAYLAMFAYLEEVYAQKGWDDIGALLGLLSSWSDGEPANPMTKADWERCVSKALRGEIDPNIGFGK